MKKTIDGKRYNTETATEIHEYSNGLGRSDFRFINETLYQTKKGVFFLHGMGGAMTHYSVCYGGMNSEGENIIPMSRTEALKWLEQFDDRSASSAIDEYFSDMVEDA